MIHQWQQFLRRPLVWATLGVSIILNLIAWVVLLINISPNPDLIVLHYTLYFGVDKVGQWNEALLIPSLGLLFLIINTPFGLYFEKRSIILSRFFLILIPITQFFVLFAVLFLVIANLPAQI